MSGYYNIMCFLIEEHGKGVDNGDGDNRVRVSLKQ
jgi:hypothetical protein